ncbi:hypothetical protein ABB37_00489 [Leptomonas pyrrhocoris]|uniref:SET domain-containing protein n=1 Tax=Leptomonas pyrrhocoris TaxID=157538 RepID=A0A0M9GAN4_LEPPY|nr:hypothetical protein ABB37_00489 [Leptomonas pyrrhocoris]KPA86259.1 hypothetical protein ABB37_00489 [Leptomonas pyrrhocoris]|eukprot:XP_015664698.1 hypothetical protein ABB37_00489 [Leptomonas pyrrhocoris]
MIILFHISDSQGRWHRCSAVCGPSTTAAGAINQLRAKLYLPTEVEVQVHLANDVPIRHLTAPLTSLRKQRSGSSQVVRMQLWASLSGPEAAVREINYSAAEAVDPATAVPEDEGDDDSSVAAYLSSSQSEHRSLDSAAHVGAPVPTTRIMFAGPPSKASIKTPQAKAPSNVAMPLHTRPTSEHNATTATGAGAPPAVAAPVRGSSRERSPAVAGADKAPTPTRTPLLTSPSPESTSARTTAAASTLVIKRRDSRPPPPQPISFLEMPLSARGPVRRPPVDVQRAELQLPQSARGVAPAHPSGAFLAANNGRYDEGAGVAAAALYKTGFARRDAALAHIMMREYPKIVPREPKTVVAAVKNTARLASLSFSKEFMATSDLEGVDDSTYARCLSIALTHGQELRSGGGGGGARSETARLALYGELSSLRHSCCPNAAVQYDLFTAPYAGSCRCAVLAGIPQGQEITYLYKHADSLAFLLLSRDRRRNILQRKYFMQCDCPRCTEVDLNEAAAAAAAPIVKKRSAKTGTAKAIAQRIGSRTKAQREAEATLTGAFFTNSTVDRDPPKQTQLMGEMRRDFDALQIVDDTGVEISLSLVGNVPPMQRTKQCNRLLAFLRKYGTSDSVLRLHEHHWRMNLARAAYVQETVRLCAVKGATPEARLRDPHSKTLFTPTKTVYDVCLKQLAVEALFIPLGHPHSLTTYESFLYLVALLPPALAQAVVRSAHNTTSIKWKQLEETKEAWSVLKRTALPPQVRRLVQRRATSSGAAAAPPSQPVTARGQRSQELSATSTIKLPPKKSKGLQNDGVSAG